MDIVEIYRKFPKESNCLSYLEKVRWKGKPVCPYCQSTNQTPLSKENRYHCNNCNTSFSVTVRTIFHHSKLPLQKWFLAICLILNAKKGISARQLARDLKVNKDTAWYMGMRIRRAMIDQRELLSGIVEMDETFIGGKPRKGGPKGGGLRPPKQPVAGMIERGGIVRAQPVKNTKMRTLTSLIKRNIDTPNTILVTDEYIGYSKVKYFMIHEPVPHQTWYVVNGNHTNTIESFWALLKRGIVGQYHKVSIRYLPKYIDEFCYRHNNRETENLFDVTIAKALGGQS